MKVQLSIRGTAPLIVQGDRLANPLDEITREYRAIAKKRNKTDEDTLALMRLEFYAGLYYDPETGPYMPAENIHRCLRDAGGLSRNGKNVTRAVLVLSDRNPIEYRGSRDIDDLWANENHHFVKTVVNAGQSKGRVIRMRPIFREWAVNAELELLEEQLNLSDLRRIAETAGLLIGLGSWRPRYGRFEAEVRPS